MADNAIVAPLKRKQRKDFVRLKLRPFVFDFLLDDSYTRWDTKQGMVEVTDPRTNEERMVHRRIWLIINKKGQHVLCLASDHYRYFRNENPGYKARYIVFTDALTTVGQFMSNPHKQSCKYFGGSVLRDSYSITLIVTSVITDLPSMPLYTCFVILVRTS